jgi:3D (Asp-Asp-Asp) domain-containing protein
VQSGDVLSEISMNHNVSVDSLLEFNSFLSNPDIIYAGQMITIPDVEGKSYTVTAYTAGYESTGKQPGDPDYGITASGAEVQEGQTIACPESLSFGTELYIPYFDKTFTCEDRGSAITEGRLDIYIADLDEAVEFGVKELQVQY